MGAPGDGHTGQRGQAAQATWVDGGGGVLCGCPGCLSNSRSPSPGSKPGRGQAWPIRSSTGQAPPNQNQ